MDDGNTTEERIYRLTVRALYVVALTLNAVLIYEQVKDSPEGEAVRARWATIKARARARYAEAKELRAAESHVVFEAMMILEDENEGR